MDALVHGRWEEGDVEMGSIDVSASKLSPAGGWHGVRLAVGAGNTSEATVESSHIP